MTESIVALDTTTYLEPYQGVTPDGIAVYEEEWLVEGLKAGAEEAYEALIARFQQPIYNLICRLLSDPRDASDVVQEVFLKVFRKIDTFRAQSSLKTWVYRIAVNESHNYRRWFIRHRPNEVDLETEGQGSKTYCQALQDSGISPYEYVLGLEKHELIEDALTRLRPVFREAVVLRDVEDLDYEEIAQVLQIPIGTVKSRILRGREALRKELADGLEVEPSLTLETTASGVEL